MGIGGFLLLAVSVSLFSILLAVALVAAIVYLSAWLIKLITR